MNELTIFCYVDKDSKYKDLELYIKEMNKHYPCKFIIEEINGLTTEWDSRNGAKYLSDSYCNKMSKKVYDKYSNKVDIVHYFISPDHWQHGERKLRGFQLGKRQYDYYQCITRFRNGYKDTAEHETLHCADNIISFYANISLEKFLGVKDFDDDIVHAEPNKYEYDHVWKKIKPLMSYAIGNKRKVKTKTITPLPMEKSVSIKEPIINPKPTSNMKPLSEMTEVDNDPKYIFWHHTGGTDANPLEDTSHHTFETIQSWHINGRGWENIGYHGVVEKDGRWVQGRPETYHAAAAKGYNNNAIHYVMTGNFDATMPSQKQIAVVKQKTLAAMKKYNIPLKNVLPHRHVANKTCYGKNLSDTWVQELVKEEAKVIPKPKPEPVVKPKVDESCKAELKKSQSLIQLLVSIIKKLILK